MSRATRETRDVELGAALRALEVPEHAPGFHAELHARLAAERSGRLAGRARRRAAVRWSLRGAAVAAAAAVVVLAVGIPKSDRAPQVQIASAAQVQRAVLVAFSQLRSLGGVVVAHDARRDETMRWRFLLDARGDFRLHGIGHREEIAYDAKAGVARSLERSASMPGTKTLFYAVRRGVAPGLPDGGPPTWVVPDEYAAFVRALLAAGDPRVHEITRDGRPAWRLDIRVKPNAIVPDLSADRLRIVVDRPTGIPVKVAELRRGKLLRVVRIEKLAVNRTLPPDAFALEPPAGVEPMTSDDGFRRVPLGEVESRVGYAPLVPARVPDGFHLAEVAVARRAGPTGTEAGNPFSRRVVSLSYRRGVEQFLVTTRLAAGGPWDDPLATGEGFVDHPKRIRLTGGPLAGSTAELLVAPRGIPHLWTKAHGLVVTVGGDLTRAQILAVTRSLTRKETP